MIRIPLIRKPFLSQLKRNASSITPTSPSFFGKAIEMAKQYMNGTKQLFQETKDAIMLKDKISQGGYTACRNELVFLHRNEQDVKKLPKFALLAIFIPEMIPFLLLRGTTLIPSTCISPAQLVRKASHRRRPNESLWINCEEMWGSIF